MHAHWRIIHRELLDLLREPVARLLFDELREATPTLRRWSQARFVASFLARRTPPLELRQNVARTLVTTTAGNEPAAQVAGIILLLAGGLFVERMGRRRGGPPPAAPFLLIFGHLRASPVRSPASALGFPAFSSFASVGCAKGAEVAS